MYNLYVNIGVVNAKKGKCDKNNLITDSKL